MKILWVSPFFLHPTDRGGRIRTLGTLKELHKRHEVHFAALNAPGNTEGPRRATEYSSRHVAIPHAAPGRGSLRMMPQLLESAVSDVPLAVSRYASAKLQHTIARMIAVENYDVVVCDFLAAVPNIPNLAQAILFQHNVETTIWQRHAETSNGFIKRFFAMQARKMETYERKACAASKYVIAVSDVDASRMQKMFGIDHVRSVPTGVDIDFFRAPAHVHRQSDLVFCGSMDWLPNVDAVEHFVACVLPLIRARRPETTFTIAGRAPDPRVHKAVQGFDGITVTGSVGDMRPYLWDAKISVVPIRIGGGTRLKIYECMAAGLPVVSTTIGAEGLVYTDGRDISIADEPQAFAEACLRLLDAEEARLTQARNALHLVESNFSWQAVTRSFEAILEANTITPSVAGAHASRCIAPEAARPQSHCRKQVRHRSSSLQAHR